MGERSGETVTGATASEVVLDATTVSVTFTDGQRGRYNRFWLRDNCPSNGDRASLFRPFRVGSMSPALAITGASIGVTAGDAPAVVVTFDDGVVEPFPVEFLHHHADVAERGGGVRRPRRGERDETAQAPCEISFDRNLDGTDRHHALLDAVCRDGFAIVSDIPDEPEATEVIASWLGPIRETDFGRVFDIVSEPDPFTPSQSEAALDPHTDDPYRYHPAGISVLHCVAPCPGAGGATTVVDGFAVAEQIRTDQPAAFELLTTVSVQFEHRRDASVEQGAAVHLRAAAPIISVDDRGRLAGIRFHERSMATLQLSPEIVDEYYRALMVFSRLVNDGSHAFERKLGAGEAVVYDNHRVLHGRSAIDGGGRRHLRLCTVDRDQVHSRLRRLAERFEPGREHDVLPAGSAS